MEEKICIGCRIPKDFLPEIQKAMEITGATSISDLLRDALREYLKQLSLLSDRIERVKKREIASEGGGKPTI